MKSIKDRLGDRSFKGLGRKVFRRSAASSQSTPASVADDGPSPSYRAGEGSQEWPGFLLRPPDASWIDIEMMGHWLHKCDQEHGGQCRRPFGLDPTRLGRPNLLIDIQMMRLVAAKPEHVYACLSYVWGNVATLKTKRATLSSLMEERSLESHRDEIPKTIRDAMGLCAQLGIPYLWVDALCIVQDEIDSKHGEIQHMAGIYANSYVAFIAGNGWDANHGLRGIEGVTDPRHLSSSRKTNFDEEVGPYDGIWYSRGWTFQEMVFSPRKIMFQYQLALWECNQSLWHETSLSKNPTPLTILEQSINPWKSHIHLSNSPDVKQFVSIVHDYALRKFTYAEDSLHAITSLLSVMSSSFHGGFVSGLPKMFFNEALIWQPQEPMQKRYSPIDDESLPSWSWAAWEGKILRELWVERWGFDGSNRKRKIVPVVKWSYGNTTEERIPLEIPDHNYAPAVSIQASPVITPRYLFCKTKRAFFQCRYVNIPAVRLENFTTIRGINDKWIGALNLNLGPTNHREHTECELVIISKQPMSRDDKVQGGSSFFWVENGLIEAYNVLWIEWIGGIAYRKALGHILKDAWDSTTTEDIDLILG